MTRSLSLMDPAPAGAIATRGAPPDARVANLDLLRATAIGLILVLHGVNMSPGVSGRLLQAVGIGNRGVDLFFVLSGWLIGGLFWREMTRFGDVEVGRFMLRRLIRTVPPYLVMLAVIWALAIGSRQPEAAPSWRYLLFLQNYTGTTTFHVSWSLCIEEHFYLLMPVLFAALARGDVRRVRYFIPALACVSLTLRNCYPEQRAVRYGATHFWLDGLLLGVAASYVRHVLPEAWPRLQRAARWLVVPGLAYMVANEFLTGEFQFRFGISLYAISLAAVLVAVAEAPPLPGARSRAVHFLAIWSYSIYLTHALAINAVKLVVARAPLPPLMTYLIGCPIVILLVGAAFHYAVEVPAIGLRDRLAPRRGGRPVILQPPIASPIIARNP